MTQPHRITNRAIARVRRNNTNHPARRRHIPVSTWLGAGAVTLGVGAALAGASGVASADSPHEGGDGAPPAHSTAAGATGAAHGSPDATGATGHKKSTHVSGSSDAAAGLSTSTAFGSPTTSSPSLPTRKHSTDTTPSTTASDGVKSHGVAALSRVPALTTSGSVNRSVSTDTQSPSTVHPPAANLFAAVESFAVDAGLSLTGLNPGHPQPSSDNPLQLLAYSIAKVIESASNLGPVARTPIVGTPDPMTGTVTGDAVFTDAAGRALTYTAPTASSGGGTVTINGSTGAFTYAPTQAQQEAAEVAKTDLFDTFTVTASDGLNSATETVTVPVGTSTSPASFKLIGSSFAGRGALGGVAVSPDGRYLYATDDREGRVSVIGIGAKEVGVVATVNVDGVPSAVAVSPNGAYAYVTKDVYVNYRPQPRLSVINLATNKVVATIALGSDVVGRLGPSAVAVSPNGNYVYVANSSTVQVISTATNKAVASISGVRGANGVAVSPNGDYVYVSNSDNSVSVINAATNAVVAKVGVGDAPSALAVNPSGSYVYVTNERSATVSVISAATNTVVATVGVGNAPSAVAISPDGSYVYVTNETSFTMSVINAATDTVVANVTGVGRPAGVAVSPDGSRVYVTGSVTNGPEVFGVVAVIAVTT